VAEIALIVLHSKGAIDSAFWEVIPFEVTAVFHMVKVYRNDHGLAHQAIACLWSALSIGVAIAQLQVRELIINLSYSPCAGCEACLPIITESRKWRGSPTVCHHICFLCCNADGRACAAWGQVSQVSAALIQYAYCSRCPDCKYPINGSSGHTGLVVRMFLLQLILVAVLYIAIELDFIPTQQAQLQVQFKAQQETSNEQFKAQLQAQFAALLAQIESLLEAQRQH
jgi:hypothetical protein